MTDDHDCIYRDDEDAIRRWITAQQVEDVEALGIEATLAKWWSSYAAEHERRMSAQIESLTARRDALRKVTS